MVLTAAAAGLPSVGENRSEKADDYRHFVGQSKQALVEG